MVGHRISLDGDGPDLVASSPTANLTASGVVPTLGGCLIHLALQASPQNLQSCLPVDVLATSSIDPHGDSRGGVCEDNAGVRLVSVLTTSPASSSELLLEVFGVNLELPFFREVQYGHGDRTGVDATAFFVGWDPLESVATGLVGEGFLGLLARHTHQQKAGAYVDEIVVKDAPTSSTSGRYDTAR